MRAAPEKLASRIVIVPPADADATGSDQLHRLGALPAVPTGYSVFDAARLGSATAYAIVGLPVAGSITVPTARKIRKSFAVGAVGTCTVNAPWVAPSPVSFESISCCPVAVWRATMTRKPCAGTETSGPQSVGGLALGPRA